MTGQQRPSCGEVVEDSAFLAAEEKERQTSGTPSTFDSSKDVWMESRLFFELASTTTLLSLGFILSPLMTASYVGRRFGPVHLSGFTLANLTGNLCTFSILSGVLSASDTLSPQAVGTGDYKEVGLLALRGILASTSILLPINVILVLYLESGLVALGQDVEAARYAQEWYRIFVYSLPFAVVSNAMWKFLSAQHVMRPMIVVSVVCTFLVLPLGLELCTTAMGFLGSAVAYVVFQGAQAIFLFGYLWWRQPHDARTWPGLGWGTLYQALKLKPMMEFMHLGAGGILVQSEWIFWEALGLVVGKLGVIALSVHTIPNQTIMAFCMVPFSFGVALAVRMGVTLPISVKRTQLIVVAVVAFTTVAFGLVSILIYFLSDEIIGMFTTNDEVKELAHVVWWKVALFNFNVAVFGILCGIATGLGKQWSLGAINFTFLWIFGLPMIYYTSITLGQGLSAAWTWINVPYLGMNVCLIFLFCFADWHAVQKKIKEGRQDSDEESIPFPLAAELESKSINGRADEGIGLLSNGKPINYDNLL